MKWYACILNDIINYYGSDDMLNERGLKTRTPFSNTLDKELFKKLDELTKETRIPKSKLLDEAVIMLLKKYGKYKD